MKLSASFRITFSLLATVSVVSAQTSLNSSAETVQAGSVLSDSTLQPRTFGPVKFAGSTTGDIVTATQKGSGNAVAGYANAIAGNAYGIYGSTYSASGSGVFGINLATSEFAPGVVGVTESAGGAGVFGWNNTTGGAAIQGQIEDSPNGTAGVFITHGGVGLILGGFSGSNFTQMFSVDANGNGFFAGNLNVIGTLTKGSGSFKIDHPLDPANKYLSHSFVESPDMMDVYNGNIMTDRHGLAIVILPGYFQALNRDFRYQLTVIGQFAQAIVAKKITNNRFVVRTSKPDVEVSWQVTGIRQDAYANAHPIPVEEEKSADEQGHYLHPELFAQPESKSIATARSSTRQGALAQASQH